MYQDPDAYKQKKLEKRAEEDAKHIALLKDPEGKKRYYEQQASKEAEERLKYTEPQTYEKHKEEKERAERYAEKARMEDPEYKDLLAKV